MATTRAKRKVAALTSQANELLALLDKKAELLKLIRSAELGPHHPALLERLDGLDSQISELRRRMTSQP